MAAWMQPEQIHLDVPLQDVPHALEYIADAVGASHRLDPAPVFRALSRREQAGSTAMGGGFAVPHARIPGIGRPLTLFVRAGRGLDFQAPDGMPVSLLLAILVPDQGDPEEHLQLLALVSQLFSQADFRRRMACAADAQSVLRSMHAAIEALAG